MSWNEYIEIGPKYAPRVKNVRKINVKQLGIQKVVVVRTKSNGGIPHCMRGFQPDCFVKAGKVVHQH